MTTPIETLMDAVEFSPIGWDTVVPGEVHATHEGVLKIGNATIRVYRLNSGQRVIEQNDLAAFFGMDIETFVRETVALHRATNRGQL